LINEKELAAG